MSGYYKKIREFIALLLAKKSLVFMDVVNANTTARYLNIKIQNPEYVPVGIPKSSLGIACNDFRRDFKKRVRVVWVGRLVEFKYYTLLRCLLELNNFQLEIGLQIAVTIVGDGEFKDRLIRASYEMKNIQVEFIDYIEPNSLDNFLITRTDLLIAMGTR